MNQSAGNSGRWKKAGTNFLVWTCRNADNKKKMTTVDCCQLHTIGQQAVVDLSKTTLSQLLFFLFLLSPLSVFYPFVFFVYFDFFSSLYTLHLFHVTLPCPLPLTPSLLSPPLPLCLPAACLSLCFDCRAPKRLLPVLPNRWTSPRPLLPLDISHFYLPRFYCCVEEQREIALYYMHQISASCLYQIMKTSSADLQWLINS